LNEHEYLMCIVMYQINYVIIRMDMITLHTLIDVIILHTLVWIEYTQ